MKKRDGKKKKRDMMCNVVEREEGDRQKVKRKLNKKYYKCG